MLAQNEFGIHLILDLFILSYLCRWMLCSLLHFHTWFLLIFMKDMSYYCSCSNSNGIIGIVLMSALHRSDSCNLNLIYYMRPNLD